MEPLFFEDGNKIEKIKKLKKQTMVLDIFNRQLKELYILEDPARGLSKSSIYRSVGFRRFSKDKSRDFTYVYLPWKNCILKSVKEKDYIKLITNRNRDIITEPEQSKLYDYKTAVLGMSVGSNIALMLAKTGISGSMIIADYDVLDTTNLNRIFASIDEVGMDKVDIVAQKINENNPYAVVKKWPKGVNEGNLIRAILSKEIDCIIDEIDDVLLKIKIRLIARRHGVPVVMVTDNGEGVILHIERYDLGYRKIFGREPSYFYKKIKKVKGKKEVGQLIMQDIVGGIDYVDSKMLTSVQKVLNHELVSWAQLGSSAMLGAVVATHAIKEIALGGKSQNNSRVFFNPYQIKISQH